MLAFRCPLGNLWVKLVCFVVCGDFILKVRNSILARPEIPIYYRLSA